MWEFSLRRVGGGKYLCGLSNQPLILLGLHILTLIELTNTL